VKTWAIDGEAPHPPPFPARCWIASCFGEAIPNHQCLA
jgi:hypothetical protein